MTEVLERVAREPLAVDEPEAAPKSKWAMMAAIGGPSPRSETARVIFMPRRQAIGGIGGRPCQKATTKGLPVSQKACGISAPRVRLRPARKTSLM